MMIFSWCICLSLIITAALSMVLLGVSLLISAEEFGKNFTLASRNMQKVEAMPIKVIDIHCCRHRHCNCCLLSLHKQQQQKQRCVDCDCLMHLSIALRCLIMQLACDAMTQHMTVYEILRRKQLVITRSALAAVQVTATVITTATAPCPRPHPSPAAPAPHIHNHRVCSSRCPCCNRCCCRYPLLIAAAA